MDILQTIVRYCSDNFRTMGTHILNHNRKNNSILGEYIFRSVIYVLMLNFFEQRKARTRLDIYDYLHSVWTMFQ